MPEIAARCVSGDDDRPDVTNIGTGDLIRLTADQYGSLYTTPWVFNWYAYEKFYDGDEDYRDYWRPLASYNPYGYLAVEMPSVEEDGALHVIIDDPDSLEVNMHGADSEDGAASAPIIDNVGSDASETAGPLVTIDEYHHRIHQNESFYVVHHTHSASAGESINIYFKTPNTTGLYIHMRIIWSCSVATYMTLHSYSTPTTGSGTPAYGWARNNSVSGLSCSLINNATVPATGWVSTDVVLGAGTELYEAYSGCAGRFSTEEEFILQPNLGYCAELESTATSGVMFLELDWYEHTTHVSV